MAKKKQPKKSLLGSLKNMLGGPPSDARYAKNFAKSRKRAKDRSPQRDLLAPFQLPMLDLDPLVHPTKNNNPRIPPKLNIGTLLVSQRHGIKCILLEPIETLELAALKDICMRKLRPDLDAMFTIKTTYESIPIETLVIQADKSSKDLAIERGTFLFSPYEIGAAGPTSPRSRMEDPSLCR